MPQPPPPDDWLAAKGASHHRGGRAYVPRHVPIESSDSSAAPTGVTRPDADVRDDDCFFVRQVASPAIEWRRPASAAAAPDERFATFPITRTKSTARSHPRLAASTLGLSLRRRRTRPVALSQDDRFATPAFAAIPDARTIAVAQL